MVTGQIESGRYEGLEISKGAVEVEEGEVAFSPLVKHFEVARAQLQRA